MSCFRPLLTLFPISLAESLPPPAVSSSPTARTALPVNSHQFPFVVISKDSHLVVCDLRSISGHPNDSQQTAQLFATLYLLVWCQRQERSSLALKVKSRSTSLVSSSQMDVKRRSWPLPAQWPILQPVSPSCWRSRMVHIFCHPR